MERRKSSYTPGEVKALIAPVFNLNPEEVEHMYIVASFEDADGRGHFRGYGCEHAEDLLSAALSAEIVDKMEGNAGA